jgi:ATP-dependent DNA helicase RecG
VGEQAFPTLPIHPAFLSDDGANDGVNNGLNEGVNIVVNQIDKIAKIIREGVNEGVSDIVNILLNISGLNAIEISSRMNKSLAQVERYLRLLRKKGIIEFRGIPKTGGYHLTDKAKDKLK